MVKTWLDRVHEEAMQESEEYRLAYQEEVERYEKVDRARKALLARLVARRKDLKLTQKDLADLTDVSQAYISQIERDRTSLSASFLLQLLDALKMELDLRPVKEAKVEGASHSAAAEAAASYGLQPKG